MKLTDEHKLARYRNLLIVIAKEIETCKAAAAKLKQSAAIETNIGKKAGLRTQMHCFNRNAQRLEQILSKNRAVLNEWFGSSKVEEVSKSKIILH